ncbi:hypothetical protein BDA99DRAFT_564934 [Phascolomyces articulosus]|uniref:Uncharacterized protein n=1 Tax=Phascolomyces articulosus TaxID=60185 RepID=A0AAD5JZC9_9FUNG|nr:hypothetical protein BDA99DRAFT_564934 [Phascolomyces articulosus]
MQKLSRILFLIIQLVYDRDQKHFPVPDSPLSLKRLKIDTTAKSSGYDSIQYLEIITTFPDDASIYGSGDTTTPLRRNNTKISY